MLDMKRGKVSGYFYKTQARPDFYNKLGEKFGLNMGKFLTLEMNDDNYDSFFGIADEEINYVAEGTESYGKKSDLIEILMQVKQSDDKEEINQLLDEAIRLYGKVLDENSLLKDRNSDLKDQLLELSRKLGNL